jgi:hypothetical protein
MAEYLVRYRDGGREALSQPEPSFGAAVHRGLLIKFRRGCRIFAVVTPRGDIDWEDAKALAVAGEMLKPRAG